MNTHHLITKRLDVKFLVALFLCFILAIGMVLGVLITQDKQKKAEQDIARANSKVSQTQKSLDKTLEDFQALKNVDQVKRNDELQSEITNINKTYKKTVTSYENLLKLNPDEKKKEELEKLLALSLTYLSQRNYASADATLNTLNSKISEEQAKLATTFSIPANVATNNTAPGSGYSRQKVDSDVGSFLVDIVAADLNSTKVIIDTASDSTCTNDCPVLSLGDYVGRSGAFAGINGSYFCPASYPSCAGKTNSFDTLLMNKNKVYFNSDNNIYSNVPVVAFYGTTARFMGKSSDWGRDTGVDGVIANQPLLLLDGNIVFNGDGDPKKGSVGSRSFVASKGSTVYIGVVHNATVAEVGHVLKTMGIQNALNLDSGGSTALWSGGYKVGPGRNIPNAVLFVHK